MNLPTQYAWVRNVGMLPRMVDMAINLLGTKEISGQGNNATIMEWANELRRAGVDGLDQYSNDDIPWCGLFAAILAFRRRGIASEVVQEPLWARNWDDYGNPIAKRVNGRLVFSEGKRASLGDVLVFERGNGGHVALYIAEDAMSFHVIGGNQTNAVTVTRILKSRCIAVRRPHYVAQPASVRPFHVAASGSISVNEA
jgi:uncharacterized protein (TIGR02594 family)